MRVSVLTPTFNRRDYLKETIESFLSQDYEDKEMIIVDDGGTDGTETAIREMNYPSNCIYYHRKENGGISSAYNYGLERATGELICVMQDDDLFFSFSSITNRVNVFLFMDGIKCPVDVIWTAAMDINEDGSNMKRVPAVSVNVADAWKGDRIYTETMMWRKSIHERIGAWDPNLTCNEDWDFKLRCLMECQCLSVPGITSAKYRRHGGNASIENIKSGRRGEAEKIIRASLKKRYVGVYR